MKSVKLEVVTREERGTAANRRLRRAERAPIVLYGLGRENLSLTCSSHELDLHVDRGVHIFELSLDGQSQVALLKDVQWDGLGSRVLHADFIRVDRSQPVQAYIPIRYIGAAPTVSGSIVDRAMEDVQVEVLPLELPDNITINLKDLAFGQSFTIADLEVPEGCKILHEPGETVVSHHALVEKEETETSEEGEASVEPEVIGAKPDDSEGD